MVEFSKKLLCNCLLNLFARGIKNFGFICIGISICALIEVGLYWELIGLSVLSLAITILSYPMIKKTEEQLKNECEEEEIVENSEGYVNEY